MTARISEVGQRCLRLYELITPKFFGRYLHGEIMSVDRNRVIFRYTLSRDMCRDSGLTCSAAFAIFDELSTVGLMALDKSHRPGVSVTLNTNLMKFAVKQGEELTVDCLYDKIGQNVAFTTMVMKDSCNEVVAQGSHVKFLPISWLYDNVLSSSLVFPWLSRALCSVSGPTWAGRQLLALFDKSGAEDAPVSGSVFRQIQASLPAMQVRRNHCNPFSMLHGGCTAMIIEESLRSVGGCEQLTSLSVNFLSSIPCGRSVQVLGKQQSVVVGDREHAKFSYTTK